MYKRVSDFLNSNNILAREQFGFGKSLSTDKALFNFTHEMALKIKRMLVEYLVILLKHLIV
jgi:hypothetical protein